MKTGKNVYTEEDEEEEWSRHLHNNYHITGQKILGRLISHIPGKKGLCNPHFKMRDRIYRFLSIYASW